MYDEPTAGLDRASTVVEDLMRSSTTRPEGRKRTGDLGGVPSYIVVTHQHSTIRWRWTADFSARGQGGVGGHLGGSTPRRSPSCGSSRPGSLEGPIVY